MNHYIYRITNIVENRHYYGVRSCKHSPKDDLGIKYFSSSKDKDFIEDQKKNPQNYKYKIILTVKSREKAVLCEIKLHAKFNVGVNESFYNRAKQTTVRFDTAGVKFIFTEEHKQRISEARKGKKHSEDTKRKMSENRPDVNGENNPFFGKIHSDKTRTLLSEKAKERYKDPSNHPRGMLGKTQSEESNKRRSETLTGQTRTDEQKENYRKAALQRKWKIVECPHCKKEGKQNAMLRWHFDNCNYLKQQKDGDSYVCESCT
jgi:hypothetical protein